MFDLLMTIAKIVTITPLAVVVFLMLDAVILDSADLFTRKDLPK